MFVEERKRGIYDVDTHTPSTITAHAPGYIDREHELIVGLQTDAPLRQGMENIRAALANGAKTIEQYEALAARVAGEVAYIVQNCKLPEDADAQLHLVIAEILEGTEAMQGRAPGLTRRAGAERVAKTLDQYASFFDHPGWEKP